MSSHLLEIKNLSVSFRRNGLFFKKKPFWALKNINLTLEKEETLALLGESGSGKTTLGRVIVRLIKPTEGQVLFKGRDIFSQWKREYTKEVSMIFQNPREAINPRFTVWEAVSEPLIVHKVNKNLLKERVEKYLLWAGIDKNLFHRRVEFLSGGQRQRVAIARSLVLEPTLVVADEPTSALDMSLQYEILKLFKKIKTELKISQLFITHDIRTAAAVSDRVAVMLGGRIMEVGPTKEVIKNPLHPYTRYLLENMPVSSPFLRDKNKKTDQGELFQSVRDQGCPFRFVCPQRELKCTLFPPKVVIEQNNLRREVYCWHYLD
ncbi:MAG: ABC transporter ATP-binding protein [Aquificae bacterium]|nr:ABC transporter ATP-binding protein [Aquificota bacterium]